MPFKMRQRSMLSEKVKLSLNQPWNTIADRDHQNEGKVLEGDPRNSPERYQLLNWNQILNIWSHVFGAALFFTLPIYVFREILPRYGSASGADIVVFSTFFFGVAICLALSASFHIFNNHSRQIAAFGNQLDYLGIVILMWGSTIPCVYYGFYCDPHLQSIYWGMVSVLALICAVMTVKSGFRSPNYRAFRSAMYSGLGLSFIIPIIHAIGLYGWRVQLWRMSLDWMLLMASINLAGAATYAMRVPERWYPTRHDIYGASHQILHLAVIFAGLAHMFGLLRAFDHLHSPAGKCKST
ncbi:HlyIII-domain-containing protein [Tothia fuscella]|uniref:HlyIII-domain-containing protein n=1 Tax=Tothia fuscella TaxID=1048955 RepID=A0A9P4NNA6_9PEZI|nr:HlyIII-domain-containing protein [Tothia fuscella]